MRILANTTRRGGGSALLASVLAIWVAGIGACGAAALAGSDELNLVAYSTPVDLYEDVLLPGFAATGSGAEIEVSGSFGSSGDQSRSVEAGQPADLIHLSLEPDMERLVEAGIVAPDWKRVGGGMLQNSLVVLAVREGNPKQITDWQDLVRDDIEVLTPNPFTSGGARWNIMALYGSQTARGATHAEALEYVSKVLANTSVQDKSAADSLNTFLSGKGDVLISYENEAFRAREAGEQVEYVVPANTLLIETPVAVPIEAGNREQAVELLRYLRSDRGQAAFARAGYRPVDRAVLHRHSELLPAPRGLITIDDLGGWSEVTEKFFDPDSGEIAEIQRVLGVSS